MKVPNGLKIMVRKMSNWYDSDGGLHLRPNPDLEQSENAPTFSGCEIALKYEAKKLSFADCARFVRYCKGLYRDGRFWTTSISQRARFSHDSYTGIVVGLITVLRFLKKQDAHDRQKWHVLKDDALELLDKIPFWHKHPRDFIWLNYMRGHLWLWPLLIIPSVAMIVSCMQDYKVRGGVKILKTDGKILALMRCLATPMPLTLWACTNAIETDNDFGSWSNVFAMYFWQSDEHPNRVLIKRVEDDKRL